MHYLNFQGHLYNGMILLWDTHLNTCIITHDYIQHFLCIDHHTWTNALANSIVVSTFSEGSDTKHRSRNSSSSGFFSLGYGGALPWPNWNMIANWLSSHSNQGCYINEYTCTVSWTIAVLNMYYVQYMYMYIRSYCILCMYRLWERGTAHIKKILN